MPTTKSPGPRRALLVGVIACVAASGCADSSDTSRCTSGAQTATLSAADRRDPLVATDGARHGLVAWEAIRGGPVEVSSRTPDGRWSAPAQLGARGGRYPSPAVSASGHAVVAWQASDGTRRFVVAVRRDAAGHWGAPMRLSADGGRAPEAAIDPTGRAVVTWTREIRDEVHVEVTEGVPDGPWTPSVRLSAQDGDAGTAEHVRVAIAPTGGGAIVWDDSRDGPTVARRTTGGQWSRGTPVAADAAGAQSPDIAVNLQGRPRVAWLAVEEDHVDVVTTVATDAGWDPPVLVGRGDAPARRILRPRRGDIALDIVTTPDDRSAIVWTLESGGRSVVAAAMENGRGRWDTARVVSSPGTDAGSPSIATGPAGVPIVGWEEIDGGLLRARVTRLGASDGESCRDVGTARGESATLRVAGGAAPIAVSVNLNRNTIELAQLP